MMGGNFENPSFGEKNPGKDTEGQENIEPNDSTEGSGEHQEKEMTSAEIFFSKVKERVDELVEKGSIGEEYARGVLERAGYIETNFSDDLEEDARKYLEGSVERIAKFNERIQQETEEVRNVIDRSRARLGVLGVGEGISEKKRVAIEEILDDLEGYGEEVDSFVERLKEMQGKKIDLETFLEGSKEL